MPKLGNMHILLIECSGGVFREVEGVIFMKWRVTFSEVDGVYLAEWRG